jgi:hypothetical protein
VVSAFCTGTESPRHPHANLLHMPQTIHRKEIRCDPLFERLQKPELSETEGEPTNLGATDKIN